MRSFASFLYYRGLVTKYFYNLAIVAFDPLMPAFDFQKNGWFPLPFPAKYNYRFFAVGRN